MTRASLRLGPDNYCSSLWDTCCKQLKDKRQKFKAVQEGLFQARHMMLGLQMC